MDTKNLMEIINEWDPVDLLAMHAPEDEYISEIEEIQYFLERSKDLSVDSLDQYIRDVFSLYFGEDVYERTDELEVAQKIISKLREEQNEKTN